MDSRCKSSTLPLMAGVILLFGMTAILPSIEFAQIQAPLHNARPGRVAIENDGDEEGRRSDRPDEALRFRRLQLQDEKGVIPANGIEKARQQVKQMKVAPSGTIKSETWSWLGPGNIGGRIRTIVIDPINTNTMWVGSVGGGIWRTVNGGDSWQPVDDFAANLAVSTMVIDPTTPGTMYAGTGESFAVSSSVPNQGLQPDGLQGAGVFKSTDTGLTWNQLPNTNPSTPAPAGCGGSANCPWLYVNRLAISQNGTILAATNNGIQRSVNGGTSWTPTNATGPWLDVEFHPTDNQRAIASCNGSAAFSTNGGQNWTLANFNPAISGRVEVAYAPSAPTTLYAAVDQNFGEIYQSPDGQSTNGAQTFTRVNTGTNFFRSGNPPTSQGNYDNIIWVNPQDPTFVIVGGIDLWRSTNSGGIFTKISDWQSAPGSSAHADHHMIIAHPNFNNTTNRIAFFGNDGGIYRADNVQTVAQTSGWVNRNNNLGITQFYGAAGNFAYDTLGNPFPVIIGGAQDNGTLVYSGTTTWDIGNGGDGGYCAADPIDRTYYGEYIYLTIYRSMNGSLFGDIYNNIADAGSASTANFIAPFILDPNNSNTMLAGGLSLWRNTDVKSFAPIWTRIKQPVVPPPPPNNNDVRISAIAVSQNTSSVIAVGHNNGDIFLTFDGTEAAPNWAKIDTAILPNRFVTRLTIDNTRVPSWIYATFGGFSPDNVYRTTNLGATWTDITGAGTTGLPDVPVRSLVFHPRDPNLLYVGTEIGVFTSDDAGATWQLPQNGPANVSVDDLFWMGDDLIAVTHGRGLYRASGGIYVDCNYVGTELGTFDRPFKTITAALNAATTYRTIWLKPCLYNEPPSIHKRVELRSFGGTALIRNP